MQKSIILICLISLFVWKNAQAQENQMEIKGKIQSSLQTELDGYVYLCRASDSSVLKFTLSETNGDFQFEKIQKTSFFIRVQLGSIPTFDSKIMDESQADTLILISVPEKQTEITQVDIQAKKPTYTRSPGKLTLNIEELISASGSSVFDVLERSPGIQISSTDQISLNGKQGIVVQLDGKASPLSGTDLANYLRGLPAQTLEKIEFITNPSAKYDAAGNAIINLKFKKDQRLGTNGSITGSVGHGLFVKTGTAIQLNHRTTKWNWNASYNYGYRKGFNELLLDRSFYENGEIQRSFSQRNYIEFPFQNHVGRLSVDYQVNKKQSIGMNLTAVGNSFHTKGTNESEVLNPLGQTDGFLSTVNNNAEQWQNWTANFNYKHILDTLNSEWTTDIDLANYQNNANQHFETKYLDNQQQLTQPLYRLRGDIDGKLSIYSIKTDLVKNISSNHSIESGYKGSYVEANNQVAFFNESTSNSEYDTTKSNHFIYKENIQAAYVSWKWQHKKWEIQTGLRAEWTGISGHQLVKNVRNSSDYFQFFPNFALSYRWNDTHQLDISYNRRIDRPGYDQLNPFKYYLDPTTYKTGNPYLIPQTTHNVEIGYLFMQKYLIQAGSGVTSHTIVETLSPSETEQQVTVQTNVNLHRVHLTYFGATIPIQVQKWWNIQTQLGSHLAQYSGNVSNTELNRAGAWSWNIQQMHQFTLSKKIQLEVTGNYRSREIYAYDHIRSLGFVSVGLMAKVMDNRGSIRLNFSDLFYTQPIRATVEFDNYQERFTVNRDTRVAMASFTYRFGNLKAANQRNRQGGAEDLKQRVGGGQGV